jgi:hypothetical protein
MHQHPSIPDFVSLKENQKHIGVRPYLLFCLLKKTSEACTSGLPYVLSYFQGHPTIMLKRPSQLPFALHRSDKHMPCRFINLAYRYTQRAPEHWSPSSHELGRHISSNIYRHSRTSLFPRKVSPTPTSQKWRNHTRPYSVDLSLLKISLSRLIFASIRLSSRPVTS